MKTLIFIPTYNEAENVERMCRELTALHLGADLVFCDDCSPDGTGAIVDRLAAEFPHVRAMHRAGKLGIGSAHQDGIRYAYEQGYDTLLTMDCDFTHQPADVQRLLEVAPGHAVTVASRYMQRDSLPNWNLLRRSLTYLGHFLTVNLLHLPQDATGALRVYQLGQIPRALFDLVRSSGYSFFFESLFVLHRNAFAIHEVPIALPARTYGHSKMTLRETGRSATRLLKLYRASLLHPDQFLLCPAIEDSGVTLDDPQGWDAYWTRGQETTRSVYSFVAGIYRRVAIRRNLDRIIKKHFAPGARLLHAGCGSGQVDQHLSEEMKITAVDISRPALESYRRNNPHAAAVKHADILHLDFQQASFDGAYNLGVVEHFTPAQIQTILGEMSRVVKPGGKIVIFWPHRHATSVWVLRAVHWLLARFSRNPVQLHPPEISLLNSRAEARATVEQAGFNMVDYYFGAKDLLIQAVVVGQKKRRKLRGMPALSPPAADVPESATDPRSGAQPGAGAARVLRTVEIAAGLLGLALVVALHAWFRQRAGGLWRDEVNSVDLATLPSFAETWRNLQFDSFPILFFGLLRGWTAVFSPDNDLALRTLGAMVGVAVFGAFWWNARRMGFRGPLLAFALLGCNPLFIRYTASMRAYGLGIVLMLLTFGAVWKVVESVRPGRVLVAMALAALSVQSLYYNSVLLFAMCVAGALVAAWEREWRKAVALLGVGAAAAVSLLPYASTIRHLGEWNYLVRVHMSLAGLGQTFAAAIGSPDPLVAWLWAALGVGALVFTARAARRGGDRAIRFAGLALLLGTGCYAAFLKTLDYYTQPWYFIAYLAYAAGCLDAVFGRLGAADSSGRWRAARVAALVTFGAMSFLQAREALNVRQTDVDLTAARVSDLAAPGDLIVNGRWECAVTFQRYYHGPAAQVTLPPMADSRFHHYDVIKRAMTAADPLAPVLRQMADTLRAGRRIWYVGPPIVGQPDEAGPSVAPAWTKPRAGGWPGASSYVMWQAQACYVLEQHATRAAHVTVKVGQPVMEFESAPLNVFEGWKE